MQNVIMNELLEHKNSHRKQGLHWSLKLYRKVKCMMISESVFGFFFFCKNSFKSQEVLQTDSKGSFLLLSVCFEPHSVWDCAGSLKNQVHYYFYTLFKCYCMDYISTEKPQGKFLQRLRRNKIWELQIFNIFLQKGKYF